MPDFDVVDRVETGLVTTAARFHVLLLDLDFSLVHLGAGKEEVVAWFYLEEVGRLKRMDDSFISSGIFDLSPFLLGSKSEEIDAVSVNGYEIISLRGEETSDFRLPKLEALVSENQTELLFLA